LEAQRDRARFRRLHLADGQEADALALVWTPAPVRQVAWSSGGRYGFVRTAREVYAFRMTPRAACARVMAERRRIAEALPGIDRRTAALRAVHLAEHVFAGTAVSHGVGRGAIVLNRPSQWTARAGAGDDGADARWQGPHDLSASVQVRHGPEGTLEFVAEVRDDYWQPFRPGGDGDCVRVDLPGLSLWCGMQASGRASAEARGASNVVARAAVRDAACRMLSGHRIRYSFGLGGWRRALGLGVKREATARPVAFGVAVCDSDGHGRKGELAWGRDRGRLALR
jgi:hypothetical protein